MRPLHLLHGLLAEEEGRAATLLLGAGVDPVAARTLLADLAARESGVAGRDLAPLLEQARELSGELYLERTVASDALLLVLLREGPTCAAPSNRSAWTSRGWKRPSRHCASRRSGWTSRCTCWSRPSKSTPPASSTRRPTAPAKRCAWSRTTAASPWTTPSSAAS